MKNLKYLFIIIVLIIGIKNVEAFDNTLKVYDYAQVLTEKEETKLKKEIDEYIEKYNIDMCIVTVKYYTQSILDEYINLFYNKNNFGIGINKDGIIIVLDFKNSHNNVGIQTFGKAKTLYSEYEIEKIYNKINNEKKDYKKISEFINDSKIYINKDDDVYIENNDLFSVNWLNVIIPSIIIPTIIILIGIFKNKTLKKDRDANYYIKKDSLVINKKEEKFITTKTKKERLNK